MGYAVSIVTIVGAGMMGTAMTVPLRDNGHEVRLVGTPLDEGIIAEVKRTGIHPTLRRSVPDGVQPYPVEQLQQALANTDLLIAGVSSFGVEWFSDTVLPLLAETPLPVLAVTKGLAGQKDGTVLPFPHLWHRRQPAGGESSFQAIGGPCTSYELADRRHSAVVFCGDDQERLDFLKSLLETSYYHISISTDVIGVESAVALKNAYAVGITMTVGLLQREEGIGCREAYNPQAAIFGQCMREISELVTLFGGLEPSIAYGVSDLYVTVYGGRTRKLGILLGRGLSYADAKSELDGVTLESVAICTAAASALRRLAEAGEACLDRFPLLLHIDEVINRGQPVNIPWKRLVRRDLQQAERHRGCSPRPRT